ncbi:MAG TPA: pyridoxamine 5'-phosphate oxidase family protein [Candidatus Limnocylindrales bacterium]|jgi:nitroimidazol reductase NimA-like FMN-containing flavoprotein (pyridoxamine 5'-phosphate oxidase superfamily)
MKWQEFKDAAPQLGALAQEAFDDQHVAILGTLRSDGRPRISPCEVYFTDGELLLGMMPNSRKVDDLRRDPRITVVNGQEHREPKLGDVKLYGTAREVTDSGVRQRFGDEQYALIEWRPPADAPLYAVDVESASYISFGQGRRLLRWSPSRGEEELTHPERDDD